MSNLAPQPQSSMAKAHAGAGAVVFGEAVAQIVIKIIQARWPTFVDDLTAQSIGTIVVALVTWGAVYITPPGER